MSCNFHPNVDAIENCSKCNTPLCGLCASYLEAGVFCEACVSLHEAEQLLAEKFQQQNQANGAMQEVSSDGEYTTTASGESKNPQLVQWLVIGACMVFMSVRLLGFPGSTPDPAITDIPVAELQLDSLVQCMLVFEEIGEILQSDEIPDPSLRCNPLDLEYIITRDGDDIRVSHPDPSIYGVNELFVSKSNPTPNLIN